MKWLLGCGALLLIVIGLIVALGFVMWGEVEKVGDAVRESSATLDAVEEAHPFTIPPEKILDPERVDLFLTGRERLAAFVDENTKALDSGSWYSRVNKFSGLVQNALPEYAAALEEIGMSPIEYSWIANEVSYTTQYSKRDEVLAEFPQMARLHRVWIEEEEESDGDSSAAEEGFLSGLESSGDGGGWQAISQIDPDRLIVPRRNLEIIADRVDRIAGSRSAMGLEVFVVPMYTAQSAIEEATNGESATPETAPETPDLGSTGGAGGG